MLIEEKIAYNQWSAETMGWTPDWFGATGFDSELIEAIERWQLLRGLKGDGLVGNMTYRRALTARLSAVDKFTVGPPAQSPFIIVNGQEFSISWDRIIRWVDPGGLGFAPTNYRRVPEGRPVMGVMNHWDVCLSSTQCHRVLSQRGLSVHFAIDNDGTIYQFMDTKHAAFHSGNRTLNTNSIGIEISNAWYPEYNDWYVDNGLPARRIWSGVTVHDQKLPDFLGFYDIQLRALIALWRALGQAYNIPAVFPEATPGKMSTTTHLDVQSGEFRGFFNHYHLTTRKIDCAGLNIPRLLRYL